MELTNEFRVGAPVEQAWEVLTDVERIAPCMPGAELEGLEGDEYRGTIRVKVGPVTAQYKGGASFVEQDAGVHRAVLRAQGRETRGQGNARATITATLAPDGDGTRVNLVTDLSVSGRVAQFGRGVLSDVSTKLVRQFVDCLEANFLSGNVVAESDWVTVSVGMGEKSEDAPPAAPDPSTNGGRAAPAPAEPAAEEVSGPSPAPRPVEPLDLVGAAGASLARRLVPPMIGALFVGSWLARRWQRRRHRQ
jgi:carbon monoxide dehydrogenase subunit G